MKNKNNYVTRNELLVGLLLKFKKIDAYDFCLLSEKLKKEYNVNIVSNELFFSFARFFCIDETGSLKIRNGYDLNCYPDHGSVSLKEIFEQYISLTIKNFIKNINLEQYYEEKKQKLEIERKDVKEKARILLISDDEKDLLALQEYGFINIDYFKSQVRAINYFEQHPEILKVYHAILQGHLEVDNSLTNRLIELPCFNLDYCRTNNVVDIKYNKYYDGVKAYLSDNVHNWYWDSFSKTMKDFCEEVVKLISLNQTLECIGVNNSILIKDYVNHDKIALPKKVNDLKILYCDDLIEDEIIEEINSLELNVTFTNFNRKELFSNLGNFDIIIVNNQFYEKIANLNIESTEQCKDTGRQLTLLVNVSGRKIEFSDATNKYYYAGQRILCNYSFGGELAPFNKITDVEFQVVSKDENSGKSCEVRAVLESVVNIYSNMLKSINANFIINCQMSSVLEFSQEFENYKKNEELKKERLLAPVNAIKELRKIVSEFIELQTKYSVPKLDGISVNVCGSFYIIEISNYSRNLCALYLPISDLMPFTQTLKLRTLSDKGSLGKIKEIIVSADITRKQCSDDDMKKIYFVIKKIKNNLVPIISVLNDSLNQDYANEQKLLKNNF